MPPVSEKDAPSYEERTKDFYLKCYSYYSYLGMSYDEYWCEDPRLVRCYREAHELKRIAKNQELHLQGIYIYEAFASVMSDFAAGLSGKKTHSGEKYPEYPHPITKRELEEDKKRNIAKTYEYLALVKRKTKERENVDADC